MNKQSKWILVIIIAVIVLLIIFGLWYYNYNGSQDNNNTNEPGQTDTNTDNTGDTDNNTNTDLNNNGQGATAFGQSDLNDESVLALTWLQNSGEYVALCYQAFNAAQNALDEEIAANPDTTKAIVLDVDETVLDNSQYNVGLLGTEFGYEDESWANWVKVGSARAVPGVLEFLKYADSQGINIYYVTNRKAKFDLLQPTMDNLNNLGFPQVSEDKVLLRTEESSKEARRSTVGATNTIIMLVGDNLEDFDLVFEDKSNQERRDEVMNMKAEFGDKFIILPNPVYGSWEGSLDENYFGLDAKGKSNSRRDSLTTWAD